MPPKTILYISPSSRLLGARRSLLQLAANLDPERYRPVVVSKPRGDLVDALNEAGIPFYPLPLGEWRKARYWLARPLRVAQLARIARQENAALIHCNEFHVNPYGVRAARRAGGLPVVTHMRLSITPRQIRNYDLAAADRVVCVSRAATECFRDCDWKDRIEVVYNGVDLREFEPRESREETRRKLQLDPEDFVVGQFGLLSPRKRPHVLLKAAAILKRTALQKSALPGNAARGRIRFLIVGSAARRDADYDRSLRETVAREKLGDIVRFVPFTPDMADVAALYQACDVNILISSDEGFGRTIIEAAALGVPSIGSSAGGIPELIEDGRTGFVIPAGDEGPVLADRLRALRENPSLRGEMGRHARKRTETLFSIARHAEAMMGIYDRVLGVVGSAGGE